VQTSRDTFTYERFFGLWEKPFSLASDPRFLYPSTSHAVAFDELLAGIRRREGLLVLTGDIGTGKTTLCRAVLRQLDRKTFSAFIPDPFASREDLLKMLLIDFGVVSIQDLANGSLKTASRTELNYLLSGFLDSLAPLEAFVVMFIDEAQNMSLPMIEEVRILSDTYGQNGQLQVVFVGQLELHSKLKLPEMRQVDQRVCAYCRLEPLTADAVVSYVRHRLEVAGGTPDRVMFGQDVFERLHQASGGVPRVINRICDRALHLAYLRHATSVDSQILEAALVDVGLQVPAAAPVLSMTAVDPVIDSREAQPSAEVAVEFPVLPEEPATVVDPVGDREVTAVEQTAPVVEAQEDGQTAAAFEAIAEVYAPARIEVATISEPLAEEDAAGDRESQEVPLVAFVPSPPSPEFSATLNEWLKQTEGNPKLGVPSDPYEVPRDAFPASTQADGAPASSEPTRVQRSGKDRRNPENPSTWFGPERRSGRDRRKQYHTETYMQKMVRRWTTRGAIAAGIFLAGNLLVRAASPYLPTGLFTSPEDEVAVAADAESGAPAAALPPTSDTAHAPATTNAPTTPNAPPAVEAPATANSAATPAAHATTSAAPSASAPMTTERATENPGRFHVAVGLFAAQERAVRLVNELTQSGFVAYHRPMKMGSGRVVEQVLLGPYTERTRAEAALEQLRRHGGFNDATIVELPSTGRVVY
jgi:type II secretory pathway predicted ATPase ExeA/cell division septation protein DedD